jgi:hypothetical protein
LNILYVKLLYHGRDYPLGYKYFRDRAKKSFLKNRNVTDKAEIESLIKRGEFVVKEIEALYNLKKYRTLKKNYYDSDEQESKISQIVENISNIASKDLSIKDK